MALGQGMKERMLCVCVLYWFQSRLLQSMRLRGGVCQFAEACRTFLARFADISVGVCVCVSRGACR